MAENYTKAQRNKRDLERKLKILNREVKINLSLLKSDKETIASSLLDVQSKTKNLTETMAFIRTKLIEEKQEAENILHKMSEDKSAAKNVNEGAPKEEETTLRNKIVHHRAKLDWIQPDKKSAIVKTIGVMDLVGGKTGFKGILAKIRSEKTTLPHIAGAESKTPEEKPKPSTPNDICGLIDHFLSLPKIYPVKPKKVKPKVTTVMLEKYAERKKKREMCMSYGTRRRLKRVDHHFDTIKDLFLTV